MIKRYYNKSKDGHLCSICLYCSVTFHHTHLLSCYPLRSHTQTYIIHPHSLNTLPIIQLSAKYTFILLRNAVTHTRINTHTFKYRHAHSAPVYLRLLLLGCDPARPGWSGLWRFWRWRGKKKAKTHWFIFNIHATQMHCADLQEQPALSAKKWLKVELEVKS